MEDTACGLLFYSYDLAGFNARPRPFSSRRNSLPVQKWELIVIIAVGEVVAVARGGWAGWTVMQYGYVRRGAQGAYILVGDHVCCVALLLRVCRCTPG